jgi:hypothetical protein
MKLCNTKVMRKEKNCPLQSVGSLASEGRKLEIQGSLHPSALLPWIYIGFIKIYFRSF